jgi:hypothetical protein
METSALIIDAITTILTAFITFGLIALLPYLQARSKQKAEQAAILAETDIKKGTSGTEALEKMTGAFGDIQDFYAQALSVANAKVTELREQVAQHEKLGGKITQMEEMADKIVELTDKIIDLKRDVKVAKLREARARELVTVLMKQLNRLDEEPEVTLEDL